MQPRSLTELASPACLIEDSIMRRNAERMWKKTMEGTILRPHVKTHKCPEIARLQLNRGTGPICVSTLREAEYFFSHGFTDITYAVPLSVNLVSKAIALSEKVPMLHLLIDHLDILQHITSHPLKRPLSLFIKIDCGYHRAGIEPENPMLVSVARFIDEHPMLSLQGLLTHAGHSYDCRNQRDILVVADEEEGALHLANSNLLSVGIRVPTLSLGSTPTCSVKETWNNIDEIRPGNYIFYDLFQASIGSCNVEDIAISVLCEVIGVYPERSSLLINAGALALSKDLGFVCGIEKPVFGMCCDQYGNPIPELKLHSLSQEHGKIMVPPSQNAQDYPIGTKLRILPNHSCLVTALHPTLYVVDGNNILQTISPTRGWVPNLI